MIKDESVAMFGITKIYILSSSQESREIFEDIAARESHFFDEGAALVKYSDYLKLIAEIRESYKENHTKNRAKNNC